MGVVDYQRKQNNIDISVVVPVYNENESLEALFVELEGCLDLLPYTWEVIFIDDGSIDGSFKTLVDIQRRNPRVGVIQFRKNFGQTAALSAGFDLAHGEIIITLDADLQNDPADIQALIDKITEGYDIASGWRFARKDKMLTRRLPSKIANSLISRLTGVRIHDYGCTLKAYRRDVVKGLRLYGELHRFIPALANEQGARVTEVKVNHRSRKFGQSKYTLSRTTRVLLDLATVKFLLEYRTRPLQFFGKIGLLNFFIGTLVLTGAIAMKIFQEVDLTGNPLFSLSFFLYTAGVQLISIGLVGELVARSYYEIQGKSVYVAKTIIQPAWVAKKTSKKDAEIFEDVEV